MIPQDLRYHQEHEWVRVSRMQATVGISHFAQDALGDIVFIDLPKPGAVVKAGQQIGEVESTNASWAKWLMPTVACLPLTRTHSCSWW